MDVQTLRGLAAAAAALLSLALPAAAHASYADHVLATPGLEWYLPLDETAGATVSDAVSGENFGGVGSRVALGQPGAWPEAGNHAVRFLGGGHDATSESHIALGNLPTEEGGRAYSFEAWVNVEASDGRALRIFSDEDYMGGVLLAARDGRLVFSRYDSGLRFGASPPNWIYGLWPTAPKHATTVSAPVTPGVWTYVVGTYDGGSVRLFTDGAERASAPSTFPIAHEGMVPDGQGELGVRSALRFDGRYWLEFRGSLDAPAVYRRALTPCDVADHYRAAITPPPSSSGEVTVCGTVPPSDG